MNPVQFKEETLRRFAGVAVVGIALLIAGCGGSDSGGNSDEDQINEAMSSFSSAIADGDYAAVCDMYNPETTQFFEETKDIAGDCEALTESTYGGLDESTVESLGEVETVEISGDTATLELGNGDPMVLQKVDGEWKLTLD